MSYRYSRIVLALAAMADLMSADSMQIEAGVGQLLYTILKLVRAARSKRWLTHA